jgi:ABC-type cobalamin/Fe3+-siderophores transport system ATPase subunit
MFEEFYGFSKAPFSRDIPTSMLYQPEILEEVLGRLNYAAQRQLFAVVTGDCGTGKTTVVRMLKVILPILLDTFFSNNLWFLRWDIMVFHYAPSHYIPAHRLAPIVTLF